MDGLLVDLRDNVSITVYFDFLLTLDCTVVLCSF